VRGGEGEKSGGRKTEKEGRRRMRGEEENADEEDRV